MKRLKMLLLMLILMACGGEASLEVEEAPKLVGLYLNQPVWSDGLIGERPDVLGQAEQSLIVPQAGLGQVGTRPGSLRACEVGNTGQDCIVPAGGIIRADGTRYKELVYFIGGTNAAPVRTQIEYWKNQVCLNSSPTANCGYCTPGTTGCKDHDKYYIREATSVTDPAITFKFSVTSNAAGACSGSAGNVTDSLCFTGFTESVDVVGLDGAYHYWTEAPVATVDYGHIQAMTWLNLAQREKILRQVVFDALDVGVGRGLDSGTFPQCSQDTEMPNAICDVPYNVTCIMRNTGDYGNRNTLTELPPNCG